MYKILSKIDYIASKQGSVIEQIYFQIENKSAPAQQIIQQLSKADPTRNQQYLQWLTNMYLKKQFRMEDLSRIRDELVEFERVKSKLANKDINQYRTLGDLYDALEPFEEVEVISNKAALRAEEQKYFSDGEAELIYKDGSTIIISPKTEAASCFFGKGTKWCTAAEKNNMFDQYAEQAPLYIVIYQGKKYQFQFESSQFMDERDQPIDHELLMKFRSDVAGVRELFREYEKRIVSDPEKSYYYAKYVIKARWIQAEPIIMKYPEWAYYYTKDVIKGRWKEAEPVIMKYPEWASWYAREVIKGRWIEAEPYIMKNSKWASLYARYVIGGPWPEAGIK